MVHDFFLSERFYKTVTFLFLLIDLWKCCGKELASRHLY